MFDLALPWWELITRGAVVYIALMLLVRLSGKRTVGQFTPFDLLVVMLLSEAVSNSLSGGDNSLVAGLVVAATLVALNMAMSYLTAQSKQLEELIEGAPLLIARDGKVFEEVLRKQRIGPGDMEKALRESDCELKDLDYAFLETDGQISVKKK